MSSKEINKSLEMGPQVFKALGTKVVEELTTFVGSLGNLPVASKGSETELGPFGGPMPTKSTDPERLLNLIFEKGLRGGYQFHSPGYQCYIPIGGLLESSLAEWIVSAVNPFVGLREWSPVFNEIERTSVAWLNEIIGLPSGSSGVLTSGGSLANLTAIFSARANRLRDDQITKATMYLSTQAHHSLMRAGFMTGVPRDNIRLIGVDSNCRVDLAELESQLKKDVEAGFFPFVIVGMGGTTASGAIDDLQGLAALCQRHGIWFHVDAAWAGGFRLIEGGRELFRGIEKADSVTFDPHKALFTPMGCGALLVRDWKLLEKAHSVEIGVIPNDQEELEYNPSKGCLELLRPARALSIWLPLKMHGIGPFVECHEEKMALARYAFATLKKIPGIELLHEPQVAAVVFRFAKRGTNQLELDALNKKLIALVNDSETKISGAPFDNGYWARIVPFGLRTHQEHVDRTLARVKQAVQVLSA